MDNHVWDSISQGVDAAGAKFLELFDNFMNMATSKVKELGGGLAQSFGNMKQSIGGSLGGMLTPNTPSQSKASPSPSIERSQSISIESPAPAKSHDFGDIMNKSGLSADTFSNLGAHATDMGNVSVGQSGVGCASYDAPRATATMAQNQEQALMFNR